MLPILKRKNQYEKAGKVCVNKLTYGLLLLFLGEFGIHEFYAGNYKKAFIWLGVTLLIAILRVLMPNTWLFMALAGIYAIVILFLAIITFTTPPHENNQILITKL